MIRETNNTRGALMGAAGVARFRRKLASPLVALLAVLVALVPIVSYSLPGLGISISFVNDGPTDAERAGSLWVGVEQGESVTRTMNIRSLSDDTTQALEFEIFDIIRTDAGKVTDYSKPSRLTPWLVVSPESAKVGPGETITVTLTFSAPEDAQDEAFDAVLRVLASGEDSAQESDETGTKAIVKTKLAIEANLWLGVGDALTLEPNFEIESVDGALIDDKKYIRIFFRNNGIVSIQPAGRFQLSDPVFVDRIFEPVDFEAQEILAGQLGFVDVPVPDDLIDGVYRSFVTAQSGSVRKTQLFEGELVFDDPSALSIPDVAIRIGIFVLAALGLVFGVRLLRSSSRAPEPKEPRPSRFSKRGTASRKVSAEAPAAESQATLDLLRQMVEKLEAQQVEIRKLAESVPVKPTPKTTGPKAPTKPTAAKPKAKAQTLPKASAPKTGVVRKPAAKEAAAKSAPKTRSSTAKKD